MQINKNQHMVAQSTKNIPIVLGMIEGTLHNRHQTQQNTKNNEKKKNILKKIKQNRKSRRMKKNNQLSVVLPKKKKTTPPERLRAASTAAPIFRAKWSAGVTFLEDRKEGRSFFWFLGVVFLFCFHFFSLIFWIS